jgi:hypothetical protein
VGLIVSQKYFLMSTQKSVSVDEGDKSEKRDTAIVSDSSSKSLSAVGEMSVSSLTDLDKKSMTWRLVCAGELNVSKLQLVAQAEFDYSESDALEKVLSLIWLSKKERVTDESIDLERKVKRKRDDVYDDDVIRLLSRDRRERRKLLSPSRSGDGYRRSSSSVQSMDVVNSLDEVISDALYSPRTEERRTERGDVIGSPVIMSPRSYSGEGQHSEWSEDEEEFELSEEMMEVKPRRGVKDVSVLSRGEILAREILDETLRNCGVHGIESWDPLALSLEREVRKRVLKELEVNEDYIGMPGPLRQPLRGKGAGVSARDATLFYIMNDVQAVMRGVTRCMALFLDKEGERAIKMLGTVLIMTSHVLAKLNGERVRIHFPREIAASALKQSSEELLRPEHKRKLKLAVDEVKSSTTLMKRFFGSGGRRQRFQRGSMSGFRRFPRRGYSSFPQTRYGIQQFHQRTPTRPKTIRLPNKRSEQ